MDIKISEWNEGFINQIREKTGLPETTIVDNIIIYYRAIKTVRRQLGIKDEMIEFGKSEQLGLMKDDDLQVFLLAYLGMEDQEKEKVGVK